MPGVQRFFSKSVPAETDAGNTPGWAPTRITISFSPGRSLPETSMTAAEKHGRCSPTFPPVPKPVALLMRDAGGRHERRGGCEPARHQILQQLAAFELIHVLKNRNSRVRQARYRRSMRVR